LRIDGSNDAARIVAVKTLPCIDKEFTLVPRPVDQRKLRQAHAGGLVSRVLRDVTGDVEIVALATHAYDAAQHARPLRLVFEVDRVACLAHLALARCGHPYPPNRVVQSYRIDSILPDVPPEGVPCLFVKQGVDQ